MAVQASRVLLETRMLLAQLFHVRNPNDIALMNNASAALNLALKGFLQPGQHVVSTTIEHNSVRRPLAYLSRTRQVEVTYVPTDQRGRLDMNRLKQALRPNTALVVCSHASNLLGSIMPIAEIADIAHAHGARLLVDAAQSAGTIPIDVQEMGIDLLAFPGHKGLLGPQGTGGLYIHPEIELEPLVHGGTGSRSEDVDMPHVRPDRYEGGTPNTVGMAGLAEGVKFVLNETVQKIHTKEWTLTQRLMAGLQEIDGLTLLGPEPGEDRAGIVSFYLDQLDCSEVAYMLDRRFGIAVRSGYHCTPLGHETAGTLLGGAVRASVSVFTTEDDVDYLVDAVRTIARQYE